MTTQAPTIADPTHLGISTARASRLVVYVEGTDELTSQVVLLPEGVDVTIGRSRGCTVAVESDRISRTHARIIREGDDVWVTDLGSRNGTRINGELLGEKTRLCPGDELSVGPATAMLTTTGSVTWRRHAIDPEVFFDRLRAEADRAGRYQRVFSVALVRLSGPAASVDEAIELIAGRMRPMDVLCDYSNDELALLLPELDADAGLRALEGLLAMATQATGLKLLVGVAAYPTHGTQPGRLLDGARAAQREATRRGTSSAISSPTTPLLPAHVVAEAPATRALFRLVEKVASSMMTVLIVGETGAGKEITAHSIHRASPREGGPFVVLNCACLPATLLESELFGHEKGAFTGADQQKTGFFEAANGGTLFLDEIGEIEPAMQAKLLRVLESRKVIRVGGTRELPIDVRVVCATNRNLDDEVREGRFRSDLFYRIAGFSIVVPPLRERRADILPLATGFLAQIAAMSGRDVPVLSPGATKALQEYAWPGNVRELRNALERASVLADEGIVEAENLPSPIARSSPPPATPGSKNQLDAVEREAIRQALEQLNGNQTHAARHLGLSRRALIYRMEKHGLKPKPGGS